jgi:hypothetical protein
MNLRIMMTLFIAASIGVAAACSAEHQSEKSAPAQAETTTATQPADDSTATGKVLETMDAGNYTYVRVDTKDGEIWAAATRFDVEVGDTVVVPLVMPMENFHSDSLDRTFPVVYFTSQILKEGETASPAMPPGHPPVGSAMAASHDTPAEMEAIEPVAGGVTVNQIWAETDALAGTPVTVRGKVVKFNGGILGTNWIHLQDGTGSAESGDNDITVTTLGTASVGDVVTVTGTLVTDQDFGAGYTYKVLVKDAELIAD